MTELPKWAERLPEAERAKMRDHIERQRRARAAVEPHARHREAERRLREAAADAADPDQRNDLLRRAERHDAQAAELVELVEKLANP